MRIEVSLECSECKRQNYRTSRNRDATKKMEVSKYCPFCRKHTKHKEKK